MKATRPPKNEYLYVLVRGDLSVGAQAAQSCHAAFQFSVENPGLMTEWYHGSNYLILLSVPDEDTLIEYADMVASEGVACSLVREPDIGDQATALAIAPSSLGARLSSLPLMGKEVALVT